MRYLLILLLFACCTPEKRIARILAHHPELIKSDTIHVTDTIITEGIKKDSSFYFYQKDTIVVQKDNLIMKYFFNRDSTIYLSGEVKRDTIYKRIKAGELPIVKIGEVIFIEAEYLSKS